MIKEDLGKDHPRLNVFRSDPRAKLPSRANHDAVGFDVYAFLLTETGRPSKKLISRMNTVAIPTGLIVTPPPGYYVQVCSRSGLSLRAVFVANAPGIIDPDYSGELMILLFNGGFEAYYVEHEHRIAQITLAPLVPCTLKEYEGAPAVKGRGASGFGSTGV